MAAPLELALRAARGAGVDVEPDAAPPLCVPGFRREQEVVGSMDRALEDLAGAPMLVDLEAALGCSARSVTRRVQDIHRRYRLVGRGAGRWRGLRDATRLVIGSIYLSHAEATPAAVAKAVGYGSVEALDHAFRAAGLPPPTALRRALIA